MLLAGTSLAGRLDPSRQFPHGAGASSVANLMTDADDDRHRPVDHLERRHEGEPHVPREPLD